MHDAVDALDSAVGTSDPSEVLTVCQKAIASAITVIIRADDSSGIIGDAIRRLLELHPQAAAAAHPPAGRLVDWMVAFQFDGKQDFFLLDPVDYAPALGETGMTRYRTALAGISAGLAPIPADAERWNWPDSHARFALEHNAQRLAVLDRDVEAIIRTHARDRAVAAWLQDTSEALAEIGEIDLAIDWAKRATDHGPGHQSQKAAEHWCTLLAEHRPRELLTARQVVFDRWPSSSTGASLHDAAGANWPDLRDPVLDRLSARPRDAVLFALLKLKDISFAWDLAHSLGMQDDDCWERLAKAYQFVDPIATLPVHAALVQSELEQAGAQHYQRAASRLRTMRRLAEGTHHEFEVDALIAELREIHRRRPRLQQEFDKARLP
jgi:hypothetical protein